MEVDNYLHLESVSQDNNGAQKTENSEYTPSSFQPLPPPQPYNPQSFVPAPSQEDLMFVYAPQGVSSVPGNPGLFVIPQGQLVHQPVIQRPAEPQPRRMDPGKKLAIAALATYITGVHLFLPYLASVIISLHMVRKGFINSKRKHVIAFSVLELLGCALVFGFGWFYQNVCTTTYRTYPNYYGSVARTTCEVEWFGWIALIVWGGIAIVFGIPRIIFTMRYDSKGKEEEAAGQQGNNEPVSLKVSEA